MSIVTDNVFVFVSGKSFGGRVFGPTPTRRLIFEMDTIGQYKGDVFPNKKVRHRLQTSLHKVRKNTASISENMYCALHGAPQAPEINSMRTAQGHGIIANHESLHHLGLQSAAVGNAFLISTEH